MPLVDPDRETYFNGVQLQTLLDELEFVVSVTDDPLLHHHAAQIVRFLGRPDVRRDGVTFEAP